MKIWRFLIGTLIFLAFLAGAAYFARAQIAGAALRAALSSAGFEQLAARVTALSLDQIVIEDLKTGPKGAEGLKFEQIEVSYQWRKLLSERRVDEITIGPGAVRLAVDEQGRVKLKGFSPKGGGEREAGPLPFDRLSLEDIRLTLQTPEGAAEGEVAGVYDAEDGGALALGLQAAQAGVFGLRAENADLNMTLDLARDGGVAAKGGFAGDLISDYGPLRDVALQFDGRGASWRALAAGETKALTGDADIRLASAKVNAGESIGDLADNSALIFGSATETISMAAHLRLELTEDGVTARLGSDETGMRADNEASIIFSALDGVPLFQRAGEGMGETSALGFGFALQASDIKASGMVEAETTGQGWQIFAPIKIDTYRAESLVLDESIATINAAIRPGGLTGDIETKTQINKATVGRLTVADAPIDGAFSLDMDAAGKRAIVTLKEGDCIKAGRAQFAMAEMNMDAALKEGQLCSEGGAPLMTFDWPAEMTAGLAGVFSADNLDFRMGETRFKGRPPAVSYEGTYRPAQNQTELAGTMKGGAMLLNDLLRLSSAEGRYALSLDKEDLRFSSELDRARIAQNVEDPMIAPFIAAGAMALENEQIEFDYELKTLSGGALGKGEGQHNTATAKGASDFVFERLVFETGGMQPERLAPVLRGTIGETTGAAAGSASFTWSSDGVGSSGKFSVEELTFQGPTRVINQTIGVNGAVAFESLWPPASDGVQTIQVGGVDFGSLQLQEGEIRFELPGDDTLLVEEARFPWFGGELGVYGATASLAGDQTNAPLRAENVDLRQVLEFFDMEGLSGEGLLSGVLPLVVEDGKASIEGGLLQSQGEGAIRYQGKVSEAAAEAGEQANIAFQLLRDLNYDSMSVKIDGPLDGRLRFEIAADGVGLITRHGQNAAVPVKYNITLDAALLELMNQALMSQDIQLLINRGLEGDDGEE